MRTLRWMALVVCATQLVAHPAAQVSSPVASQPDIIGLRLGMTEQEAVAVLRAHSSAVRIRTVTDSLPTPEATRFTRRSMPASMATNAPASATKSSSSHSPTRHRCRACWESGASSCSRRATS